MHSAFNLLVFPNYMFTSLFFLNYFLYRAMSSPEKWHLKITIIIIIIIVTVCHSIYIEGTAQHLYIVTVCHSIYVEETDQHLY